MLLKLPVVSASAPYPPRRPLPAPSTSATRVTPSIRETAMAVLSGSKESAARNDAWNLLLPAEVLLVESSESSSARPMRDRAANRPGVIHLPLA